MKSLLFGTLLCFLVPISLHAADAISFVSRPAHVNDQAAQQIQCDLDAERVIRQHRQLVDKSKQTLRRNQVRTVTVLAVQNGNAQKARVKYEVSTTLVKVQNAKPVEAPHPIAGKSYLVSRRGDELVITTELGEAISEEEAQILNAQLQTFGLPNPLAGFLNGKTIEIGQSIDVPKEVAAELLGLTGNEGKTDKLVLKLATVKEVNGQRCAVFETLLRSHSDESSMSLLMKGELIVAPQTCQTVSIQLHGPVAISERRGPPEGRFTVSTNGSLKVTVRNERRFATASATTTTKRR